MPAEERHGAEGRDRILAIADSLAIHGDESAGETEERTGWISFRLAGREFALPVSHVRGVHRAGRITPLPNSPAAVRGLTNLRGRVIAVIDLAAQLELGTTAIDERSRILDAEIGRRRIGLLAERTGTLIRVRPVQIEPLDGEAESTVAGRAAGAVATSTGRVVLLDPERILEGARTAPDGAVEARETR